MIIPPRLKTGNTLRVVAPARSLALISHRHREIANERLRSLGLMVTFGDHVEECDDVSSSAISSRVADLHAAFADPAVNGILTVLGGANSNQLLRHLDWDLIRSNPKVLCGYSDITALQNAIFAKTKLVTYSGPHYSTFAIERHFEPTLASFQKCVFGSCSMEVCPGEYWSDDPWFLDQENRELIPNSGYGILNEGDAEGTIIGGNLCTLNLLQGTEYMPNLAESVLFLEEDALLGELTEVEFDRNLQSLIHLPGFSGVRGLVIGRFQKRSRMTVAKMRRVVSEKPELSEMPVVIGADFGHTQPLYTFPIGGTVRLEVRGASEVKMTILEH